MNKNVRQFKSFLKQRGLKYPRKRKQILEEVSSLHRHFTADLLYDKLRQQKKNISRATVYRCLPLLVDSGILRETVSLEGKNNYELNQKNQHHDHLLCVACGRIIEFQEKRVERLKDYICRKNQFSPLEHKLEIKGYCRKCRKTAKKEF